MARNQTLLSIRKKFKAICGIELDETVSSSEDARINQLLAIEQQLLLAQGGFTLGRATTTVALTANTRYYTLPEANLDIDRLDTEVFVKVGATNPVRHTVQKGIGQEQYVTWDSEAGIAVDWVQRWDIVDVSGTPKIEVWPIPETGNQTLVFSGLKVLPAFAADTDRAALDDLLIALWAAAKYLARRESKDAGAILSQAQVLLNSLKGSRVSQFERFNMKGTPNRDPNKTRPIVGVSNV